MVQDQTRLLDLWSMRTKAETSAARVQHVCYVADVEQVKMVLAKTPSHREILLPVLLHRLRDAALRRALRNWCKHPAADALAEGAERAAMRLEERESVMRHEMVACCLWHESHPSRKRSLECWMPPTKHTSLAWTQ